ncbi:hypothetical protein WMY93_023887 [Mugilogobius chulae]|uniref:Uncharacterized protein n=1 Tax=Mugilogobius chulae TaxID=88201 RepID=A0AAW0NHV4_9GOBI
MPRRTDRMGLKWRVRAADVTLAAPISDLLGCYEMLRPTCVFLRSGSPLTYGPTPLTQCMPVQPRRKVQSGSQSRVVQQLSGHLQR